MANSRFARLVMEAAPPQLISVMRQRRTKVLDTIKEEEREGFSVEALTSSVRKSSHLLNSAAPASSPVAAPSRTTGTTEPIIPKYMGKQYQSCFPMFGNSKSQRPETMRSF